MVRKGKRDNIKNMGGAEISNKQLIGIGVIAAFMAAATIGCFIYIKALTAGIAAVEQQAYKEYDRHYTFITDRFDDNFWKEMYDGAQKFGEDKKVYLEWFGKDLAINYTKTELLQMAIDAKVDGIILEGDDSRELAELINQAVEKKIPVVTVLTDSYDSGRESFVGIGSYELGREYGRQIVHIATKDSKEVLILMDTETDSSSQSIVYNGIKETLGNEGNHLNLALETLAVTADTPYGNEEVIRNIFLNQEPLPDIIICLNEQNTVSAYKAVVDYNLVGQVDIIGYYVTDTILNAINRKVISATIAVDSRQMGILSMRAMEEYIETGHVSDFVTMDVNTVTPNNVKEYLRDTGNKYDKEISHP